jgi:hypothetical protein
MAWPRGERPEQMARRSKEDATERLTEFFGFQVTPAQKAELERRALATGRTPSDFARIVLLSDLKAPAPSARDPAVIRALTVEISRVGNNVNQLAHIANERHAAPQEKTLQEIARRIIAALDKVMAL